jgi:hypothetical protein
MRIATTRGSIRAALAVSALAVAMSPGAAYAAATYCSDVGGNTDGLELTDVTFGVPASSAESADDCYGVLTSNGPSEAEVNALAWSTGASDFELAAKYNKGGVDNESVNLGGITFTLTAGDDPGAYALSWTADASVGTAPDFPFISDVVIAVKQGAAAAGGGSALYLFEDILFSFGPCVANTSCGGGVFTVAFGPGENAYSHISAFIGNPATTTTTSTTTTTTTTSGTTTGGTTTTTSGGSSGGTIPEPGSPLALMGLGAALLFLTKRRKLATS